MQWMDNIDSRLRARRCARRGNGIAAAAAGPFADAMPRLFLALAGILIAGFGLFAIFGTSVIDPAHYLNEHILYRQDVWLANLAVLTAIIGLMVWLARPRSGSLSLLRTRLQPLARLAVPLATAGLMLWVAVAGLAWVLSVASLPASDSGRVVTAATDAVSGSYTTLQGSGSYFRLFPFQLGYVAIAECLLRLARPLARPEWQVLAAANVAALMALYAGILRIARRLFASRRVDLALIALLAFCLQPILFTTFLYGNLIGLAAGIWACCLTLSYIVSGRRRLIVPIALLAALSVLAKPNDWIVVIAIGIVLALHALRGHRSRRFGVLILIVTVVLCLAAPRLAVASYERRAGVSLGGGTPLSAWLAMGLQESERAPGWYNGYTYAVLRGSRFDEAAVSARIAADVRQRLSQLAANPSQAARFFARKIASQWNEPTFESIWVSAVKKHAAPVPSWVSSVYSGPAGSVLSVWFDLHLQILYLGAALGMLRRLRTAKPETALLPLIVLGAFAYHLLFEAKSQYALVYLPLLAPYAAIGFTGLGESIAVRLLEIQPRQRSPALEQTSSICHRQSIS